MVTQEQLLEFIGHKPFRAFRLVLNTGDTIDVVRRLMAVAMPKRIVVGIDNEFKFIPFDRISRVEFIETHPDVMQGAL